MKKNSILICILMSLSLVGCNSSNFNFSNRVGEEDVIDFLKEKNMDDETYDSANFLIEINEEYESKSGSSSSKIEIKGRMIVDTNDGTAEMYYKANGTVKSTSYSADGKDTEKMSMEEEFTVVSTKNKYYFDGDDLAAVYSTSSMHSVVIFHCDGNDLKSIEMSNETATMTTRIEYDFSDVERISIPKDAREYEDLTNINE